MCNAVLDLCASVTSVGDDSQARTIARLRAAGEQLAAALRIAAACARCHGEGQVDYHPRGPNSGTTLRGECDRCGGRKCSIGAMAALEGWEEATRRGQ